MINLSEIKTLPTFQLALNLAFNNYSVEEKWDILNIISEREKSDYPLKSNKEEQAIVSIENKKIKPPLKGSKAEKIKNLLDQNKNPKEVNEILDKKGIKVYPAEIYRVGKRYYPQRF